MRLLVGCAVFTILAAPVPAVAQNPVDSLSAEQYLADFDAFWTYVRDQYAYFHLKQTDWEGVRASYRDLVAGVSSRRDFVVLLERAISELYDPHAHLGVNTASSPRMIPTDTDLRAEWVNARAIITDVRGGSRAERVGLRPGMEVLSVGGIPVRDAALERLPRHLYSDDPAAHLWALQAVLAGHHGRPVVLDVGDGTARRTVELIPGVVDRPQRLLTTAVLHDSVGYVRIHNTLGDGELIEAFDSALTALRGTRGLVLDLRDTPSGGNTTVARGIMSRFVEHERPYQRHDLPAEERSFGVRRAWVEYVAPRGPFAYRAPVVVLVGGWTGSMGEGLAIGMDAAAGATVIGRPMAGLLGALYQTRLSETGFIVRVPAERLFHVAGTPRESFPPRRVPEAFTAEEDAELSAALRLVGSGGRDR